MKKSNTTLKEAKILSIAFIYFSMVLKENKKENGEILTTKMRNIFQPLTKIFIMYKHFLEETKQTMDDIIQKWGKKNTVDFLLLSVTIVSTYYEAFSGKKRNFSPLKIRDIVDIQDECIFMIKNEVKNEKERNELIENTFLYAEFIVDFNLTNEKL